MCLTSTGESFEFLKLPASKAISITTINRKLAFSHTRMEVMISLCPPFEWIIILTLYCNNYNAKWWFLVWSFPLVKVRKYLKNRLVIFIVTILKAFNLIRLWVCKHIAVHSNTPIYTITSSKFTNSTILLWSYDDNLYIFFRLKIGD